MSFALFILAASLLSVQSAPTELNNIIPEKEGYDLSQFDEVHDQRQNGTENWRINLDKIVLVWSPPGSLLTAALLSDPALLGDSDVGDSDDFFKPEEPTVIKPEGSTKPPEGSTSTSTVASSTEVPSSSVGSKRRLRVPGFLRPYLRRHHVPA